MRKKQLFRKRILTLALSVSMILSAADTHIVFAEGVEMQISTDTPVEAGAPYTTNTPVKAETPDTANTLDEVGASDTTNTPAEVETLDTTDTSSEAGTPDTTDTSDGAGTPDTTNTSDKTETPDTANIPDTAETPASSDAVSNSDTLYKDDEASQQDSIPEIGDAENPLLVEGEEGDNYIARYDGEDIDWILYKSGKLVIEGTTYGSNIRKDWVNYKEQITSAEVNISAEGDYSVSQLFMSCENLKSVDLSGMNTGRIIDMSYMFDGCKALESIDFSGCNTSIVTDMSYMFQNCSSLKSLDLGCFDTGNVENMEGMFFGCTSLESLKINSFNTSKVESMYNMFSDCAKLTSLDLSSFDTSSVTTMRAMFKGCLGLTALDVSGFNTGNVEFFDEMFMGCSALTGLDVSSFDVSSGQFFGSMFADCSALVILDISSLRIDEDDSMRGMFSNCSSLVSLDLSSFEIPGDTILLNGCTALTCIYTPLAIRGSGEQLPTSLPEHSWSKADGTQLESNQLIASYDSPVIYRDDYSGDKTNTPKETIFLSEVSIDKNRVYDNTPNEYTGTPKVINSAGEEVSGVTISDGVYTGILADGSAYESTQAPAKAGSYKLTFAVTGEDEELYNLKKNTFAFSIRQRTVAITAPTLSVKSTAQRPDLSKLTCTVDGLVGKDKLITAPTLKYGESNISVFGEETYRIIPYGAKADSNYNIRYVNGTLTIEVMEYPKDEPGSVSIVDRGTFMGGITWTLSGTGRLTVEGSTTSKSEDVVWGWHGRKKDIKSAVVNVSGLISTKGMFEGCSNMETVDLSGLDTSKVTNMRNMFYGCSALKTLDLSSFDTSKVTNMSNMFSQCDAMRYLDISSFDTSKVTDMSAMFDGCNSLKQLDLRHFDTGNVTDMRDMFHFCMTLTSLDLSSFDTGRVTDMVQMFSGCYSLKSLNMGRFNTSNVTDMRYMFRSLKNLTSLDLSSFDTGNVTDMSYMFEGCEKLTNLDLSVFDTRNVTAMEAVFSGCKMLAKLDLSGLDTGKVTTFYQMFDGCSALAELNVSYFDTSSAVDMSYMFEDCSALKDLDVSAFNTSNVTNMRYMFNGCSTLKSIDVSGFDFSKVFNVSYMFWNCTSLTSLDLSALDLKDISYSYYQLIIAGCNSLIYLKTPQNVHTSYELPHVNGDVWYLAGSATTTRTMPSGVTLCKNTTSIPDIEMAKSSIYISGITLEKSKIYDAQPFSYNGTPKVVNSEESSLENITVLEGVYTGTLANGSSYTENAKAPTQAGSYQLTFTVTGTDVDRYVLKKNSYSFIIRQETVTVTAPSYEIEINEALPALSGMTYTKEGLLAGEELNTEPKFKYSAENIDTSKAGRYKIIPYDADAGNNYRINYVNGTLTIGDPDYQPSEEPDDDPSYDDSERIDLNAADLKASISTIKDKIYDGNPYEPVVKVKVTEDKKQKTLTEGTDYSVSYEGNTNVGTGKVIISGNGIYKGKLIQTFTIKPKSIKKLKIVTGGMAENVTESDIINGAVDLPLHVYDGSRPLTKGKDYSLTFKSSKPNMLTVNVVSEQGSNYTGTATAKIAVYQGIEPAQIINPANVALENVAMTYTGKALKPKVTVTVAGNTLTNKEYKVQYQNNKDAGTAYVIVTGKGKYKGKAVVPFVIKANDTAVLQITNTIKAKTYNGKLQKPSVTVKAGKTKLKKDKDYTVSYKNNLHAGTATVTVIGKGNYIGTAEQTFTISPQKISKVSVKGSWKGGLDLTYGTRKLRPNIDYTVKCESTTKTKANIIITAVEGSDFTGNVKKSVNLYSGKR